MEYIIVSLSALVVATLTLFSGFGVGTILMPVFAFFFSIEIAIAVTAIVHFLNNIFKLIILGKYADLKVAFKFGAPAIIFAVLGAHLLTRLAYTSTLFDYTLFGKIFSITPIKLVIAILIFLFSFFELLPKFQKMSFDQKYLPFGGVISGFFGGLSGHQGAFRTAFLLKSGLAKEAFVSTGVVIACLIDFARISVYGKSFLNKIDSGSFPLIIIAILSAFLGSCFGKRIVQKITMRSIQIFVSAMLMIFSIFIGLGII
jgi:uncharacterized protein